MARRSMTITPAAERGRIVPEGNHPGTVNSVSFGLSRKASHPQVTFRFDLDGNGAVFQNIALIPGAAGVLFQTLRACGFVLPEIDSEVSVDIDDETLDLFIESEGEEFQLSLKDAATARVEVIIGHNESNGRVYDNVVAVRTLIEADADSQDDEAAF